MDIDIMYQMIFGPTMQRNDVSDTMYGVQLAVLSSIKLYLSFELKIILFLQRIEIAIGNCIGLQKKKMNWNEKNEQE